MNCLGRTRTLKRCQNSAKRLFCHHHRFQLFVLFGFVITSMATAGGLYRDVIEPIVSPQGYEEQLSAQTRRYPELRVVAEQMRVDPSTLAVTIPVRNYGPGIAEAVTVEFWSSQLLLGRPDAAPGAIRRIQDLAPGQTYPFVFRAPPAGGEVGELFIKLSAELASGNRALVFTFAGSYRWRDDKYLIRKQTGLYSEGMIRLGLSREFSMSGDKSGQ